MAKNYSTTKVVVFHFLQILKYQLAITTTKNTDFTTLIKLIIENSRKKVSKLNTTFLYFDLFCSHKEIAMFPEIK